ncbi:MAG: sigma-70 family RNA polymerase sigma factor [Bacteroidetes bacterium]|jgi:RNA polymerase sigma-70 factor (ECF subfamily)|nr:sigma-70 family RNA polymerase sigma factor [Bacteroidota bacterium]MBT6686223.1 sigma-70 family RNA polymerase sigma factor [Bacteroidota bacterium]MBT7144296.1 sigma-70 family RNA polymerase sigma factor [Bacteroidota bacterium]MBT7493515.1 sigma-70 family RNA polymerase sigma factor [Bacteroidota bacterium]
MEKNPNLSDKAKFDYNLVLMAKDGDQKAYAELLQRYRDSIYYMLLKMVNNKSDADDLTIEAFGKAFKSIHQYSPSYAFSTWLFKIATNNCIDFLRKKKGPHISIDQTGDDKDYEPKIVLEANVNDPEEELIKKQKAILMKTVVQKLKPRYRQLIELRYFKEFSYEEIADELELPIGTVKAQLFRARELLSNILKNSNLKYK